MMQRTAAWWRFLIGAFIVVALFLVALQIWSAMTVRDIVTDAELRAAQARGSSIAQEKTRAEVVSADIENRIKGVVATTVAAQIGGLAAALVTISGGILAGLTFLSTREKEREDRLATDLSATLTHLVSKEPRERIVGAAGLIPFFTPERKTFHLAALGALVAAARVEDEEAQVRIALCTTLERALRNVDPTIARSISWQGVRLSSVDFSSDRKGAARDLSGFDFRDVQMQNANLSRVNLTGANFENAQLQGARLDDATLTGANLVYADLAGASLVRAVVSAAALDGIKVLDVDLSKANFTDIGTGWRSVPWEATRNWRDATFDAAVRAELDAKYGPPAPSLRVMMLMWEIPPLVAGGTWTACYHLIRKLRRRGANVTIVVPWQRDALVDLPFGVDAQLAALGIERPVGAVSPYSGDQPWSPYSSYSSYGYSGAPMWSSYSASPYGMAGPYGVAGSYSSYASGRVTGSILFRLINDFVRRVATYARDNDFDLIHAHDWVTFDAARIAASLRKTPWIAHFHSTEAERQLDRADSLTMRVEKTAVENATRIVVPSNVTREAVVGAYGGAERIHVVPNVVSDEVIPATDMGRLESRRIVFLGRLSPQKGVDRFVMAADILRGSFPDATFEVFGDGEERWAIDRYFIRWQGALAWDQRSRAFRGTSVLIVPSRAEPFGMVILEAMQRQVPVVYSRTAGAAEVLESGVKVDAGDPNEIAARTRELLESLERWEDVATGEAREIFQYSRRNYEDQLIQIWEQAASNAAAVPP